ncbi:hypothetical protein RhiLY_14290 [Ceratobasidium sp. AG-Ba]|nr:hypothetical protein RhiLY_14290 [Ceratobasidium sp. AG-Ba]
MPSALGSTSRAAASSSSVPNSPADVLPPNPKPKLRARLDQWTTKRLEDLTRKLKPLIPDASVFLATMTGLPIVRDAMGSRQWLEEFVQKLKGLLATIESHSNDPGYMNPTMEVFKNDIEVVLDRLEAESAQPSTSMYSGAMRFLRIIDDYERQAVEVIENALVSGIFAQQNVTLPEEYDKVISNLKSLHKGNGLVIERLIGTSRADGGYIEDAPVERLHVTTHQGTYKGALVEIKEYFGGPESELVKDVQGIVNHYQTFEK